MSLRLNLLLLCLALFVGGATLVFQSIDMADWTDPAAAEAVQTWDPPAENHGPAYDAYNKRWFKAMDALRTPKWPTHDAGAALMALGVTIAAGLFMLRIKTASDVATLMTPHSGVTIYFTAAAGWFGYAGASILALLEGFDRFQFPPWDDTLVVPIVAISVFAVVGWLAASVVMFLILRHAPLPAPLWVWRKDMPMHDWLYTGFAGLAVLLGAEILRETYLYGHWLAVPCVLQCVYAALCIRAVGIARGK